MNPILISKKRIKCTAMLALIILSSCATRKDVVYFQDEPISKTEIQNFNTELVYNTDDLLTIDVSSLDPEASKPFNLSAVSYSESVISAQGNLKMQTYLINAKGEIEFPVLGTLKIGGMTRSEATNYLKERLSEYIKNPIVNIRLANFTITVIGDVNKPGTYTIQDERITLPEALGLAGDLSNTALRKNILLIREVNGEKRFAKLDLTSVGIVNSPMYYLAQNDVIYVEPNNAKIKSSTYNPNTAVIISAISTLATIAAILIR
ncbi:MAG: polysaccharide biosynthesis/export family protein [Gelidibacter sp.]